jgi:phosphotriesterase-related protein
MPIMLGRRQFISGVAAGAMARRRSARPQTRVQTVLGPVGADQLGVTLMHEHVMVDFIGAREVRRDRYNPEEVFQTALPYLKRVREHGCRTLVECTPAFIGRDASLLKRLSEASGLHIITNTGYYAAGDKYKFLPEHAYTEDAEQLARRWIAEAEQGIDGTGIKPGFIKIGVTKGPLPEIERKIVDAAALTHRATGLAIASHTGDGAAAMDQLDILKARGVAPAAFVWVHAQSERDSTFHLIAAKRGAWVEFDGVSPDSLERHVRLARNMSQSGFLERTLLSQDAGWYHVGEPGGGRFKPYEFLLEKFIPALEKSGVTRAQFRTLLESNPREALTVAS